MAGGHGKETNEEKDGFFHSKIALAAKIPIVFEMCVFFKKTMVGI